MIPLSAYSPRNGARHPRAAALALVAGALALVTGCTTGSAAPAASLTPRQAITLAADESRQVTSIAVTFSTQIGTAGTTSGSMQLRLKPTLLAHEALRTADGQAVSLEAIVSPRVIYIKGPTSVNGKPWLRVRLSSIPGGLGEALSSLLRYAQNNNPANETQMLAVSKDVRKVGTQVAGGVPTTHYRGTFLLPAALRVLPKAVRTALAPYMKLVSGAVRFDVWIDGQHVTRRLVEVETVSGRTVTTTVNVTAVNQPVRIAPPPASQVTTLPKSALSSL